MDIRNKRDFRELRCLLNGGLKGAITYFPYLDRPTAIGRIRDLERVLELQPRDWSEVWYGAILYSFEALCHLWRTIVKKYEHQS